MFSVSELLILSVSLVAGALVYVRKLLVVSGIQKALNKYLFI